MTRYSLGVATGFWTVAAVSMAILGYDTAPKWCALIAFLSGMGWLVIYGRR